VVATSSIRRGQTLGPDNTGLEWQDTTFARDRVFLGVDEVEGLRARQSIAAGSLINGKLVDLPPVIRKGDRVYLQVRIRGVQLEVQAIALEDGQQDEMIRVEIADKRKKMMARVVDASTVITVAR
jgi:flagella basal body P-ring formation protein FlgA